MTIECIFITAIILLLSLIFWRRRHIQWLWATLPLALVPFSYFVTYAVVGNVMKVRIEPLAAIIVLIAAVGFSCVWLGLVSNGFKRKKTRVTYIVIANCFNVALAAILCSDIISTSAA